MKATYTVRPGLTIEFEAASDEDLIQRLAKLDEICGEEQCGLCGGGRIAFGHRVVDKNDFHELRCRDCGARLSIGQLREGGLFPIRRLDAHGKPDRKNGQAGKHNGWSMYRGEHEPDLPKSAVQKPAPAAPETRREPTNVDVGPGPDYKPVQEAPPKTAGGNGETIAEVEWSTIKGALAKSKVGQQTFLRWCGYTEPRLIPASEYDRLLKAAQRPPKDLLAQAAVPRT